MKIKNLTDYCEIKTGKLDANAAVENGDYPFFTCGQNPERIDKFSYDDDVVLVAGNNAQANFHVSRYKGKFNAYQRTYILSAKPENDINFVYYYLKLVMKILKEHSQGSQTKFLTMPILSGIEFPDLDRNAQSERVSTLALIDQKIQLNKEINFELSKLLNSLYDYWFVQFDFPNDHGLPYKSTQGSMKHENDYPTRIPKGWSVCELDRLIQIERGNIISENDANSNGVIKVVAAGIDFAYFHDKANREKNVITISSSGASAGHLNFWREPIFASDCITLFSRDETITHYVHQFLRLRQQYIFSQARGSAQPHVYSDTLKPLKICMPPEHLLKQFGAIAKTTNDKIAKLEREITSLEHLRDRLLPMLMNGQLSVQDGG